MSFSQLPFIRPFRYRDFRLLYISELGVFLSAWMAAMIFGLITTHLKGNSPLYVGLIGFGFNIPMLLLGPFIGVVVDRVHRIRIMQIVSFAIMVAAIIMACLLIDGLPNFWLMFALVLIYGFGVSFYYPALLTASNDIIDDPNVTGNAVSIINSTNRIMMFLGYSLGGLFVTVFSEQFTFWFNAALLFSSAIALLFIHSKKEKTKIRTQSVIEDLKAGFSFIWHSPAVFWVILFSTVLGILAWPYFFQIPIANRYYFHGTPATLGLLLAIGGIGGTIGGFAISARRSSLKLTHYFIGTAILLALSMIALGLVRSVATAAPIIFLLDLALLVNFTIAIIFIQHVTPTEYQGRVMSIISMVSFGSIPIGSTAFYGGVGEIFGLMNAYIIAGIATLIAIFLFWTQLKKIRKNASAAFIEKKFIQNETEINKI